MRTEYEQSIIVRERLKGFQLEADQRRLASEVTGKPIQAAFKKTLQLMRAFAIKLMPIRTPAENQRGAVNLADTPLRQ